MWCLTTIVAINDKLAEGKSLDDAYKECGITMPEQPRKQQKEDSSSDNSVAK